MQIPETLQPALTFVGGIALFILGLSFAWKCYEAAFLGKTRYWSGLQNFGFLFVPVTMLSPLILHLPSGKNSLIKERQETYVHLLYGPVFFLCALMFMVAGADFMHLPGAQTMNLILTCGRKDVPPAITYTPPFTYKFPILKKATRTITRTLTIKVPYDRTKSINQLEKQGQDVEKNAMGGDQTNLMDDDE